jgi:hypothetical protein
VSSPAATARAATWFGYTVAGIATLVWIFCALPAGVVEGGVSADDLGTPFFRERWVLVPALVLLVVCPAGVALTAQRTARLTILAATDAFLTLYAAFVLTARLGLPEAFHFERGVPLTLLIALYLLSVLSVLETRRLIQGRTVPIPKPLSGVRLALCLLVLLVPAAPFLVTGQERATLLAPFLFVAVSAGGVRLSKGPAGLGLTAALLHLSLAIHVLVTLRYTIYRSPPFIPEVMAAGDITLDLAWIMVAAATLHVLTHAWLCFQLRTPKQTVLPLEEPPPTALAAEPGA